MLLPWLLRQIADDVVTRVEHRRRVPAELAGERGCRRCGFCCWKCPCELSDADVSKIARHLSVDARALFERYLVVDESNGRYVLRPRRLSQQGGKYLSDGQTFDHSPCVFLRQRGRGTSLTTSCEVHAAKPAVGEQFECWNDELEAPTAYWMHEDLVALGWDGDLKK